MNRFGLLLGVLALLALGCGDSNDGAPPDAQTDGAVEGPQEVNCVDKADDDGDGLVDCEDPDCAIDNACRPKPPKPCSRQSDCGNIVDELVTKCCLPKSPVSDEPEGALRCFAPGPADYSGKALSSNIIATLDAKAFLPSPTKPQTFILRFIFGKKIDGAPLSCDEVLTLNGSTEATRSQLDDDPEINQVLRILYPLTWSGASGTMTIPVAVSQGTGFILYGELWYGERYLQNPKGNRAAVFCQDAVTIGEGGQDQFNLVFRP